MSRSTMTIKLNATCYYCCQNFSPSERIRVHGLHLKCFKKWFNLPHQMNFMDLALRTQDKESHDPLHLSPFHTINMSSFQGKFKKYSATLNKNDYILKVEQPEYPELPATEYLCNEIASALKMKVPEYYLIQFENTLATFVVKNFMQAFPGGDLVHIYRYLKNPKDFNCQILIRIIQEKTGKREDIIHFIQMCLFDSLIGNHDRHGRNLGLIQTNRGLSLAPIYDNPSYLAIEEDFLLDANHEPRVFRFFLE